MHIYSLSVDKQVHVHICILQSVVISGWDIQGRNRYQFLLPMVNLGVSPSPPPKHENTAFCMYFPTVIILVL